MKFIKTLFISAFVLFMSLPAFARDAQTTDQYALTPAQMEAVISNHDAQLLLAASGSCYFKSIIGEQVKCTEVPRNSDGTCPAGTVSTCP